MEGKEGLYHSATEEGAEENFSRMASELLGTGTRMGPEEFLREIGRRSSDRRFVLAIDDYQNLVKHDVWISDVLREFIDDIEDSSRLFLILGGSPTGTMEREVLDYGSPLHGRRTGSLRLEPLDYFGSRGLLAGLTEEERLTVYGMVGGIPMYLERFDCRLTMEGNVVRSFLGEDAFFRREAELLIPERLRTTECGTVVRAVSQVCGRIPEVAETTGVPGPDVAKTVNELCDAGILGRSHPVDDPCGEVCYKMEDAFLAFYLGELLDSYGEDRAQAATRILYSRRQAQSSVFMDVCAQFMRRRGQIGTWLGAGDEAGFVATRADAGRIIRWFCRCSSERLGPRDLDDLVERSLRVGGTDERRYALFSMTGFEDDLGPREDLETCTFEEMIGLGGRVPARPRA